MLTSQEWLEIVEGIASREYHLLLGAGFSVTALSRDGKSPLPDANSLSLKLCEMFGFGENRDLRKVFQATKGKKSLNGKTREDVLVEIFSDAKPTWHAVISELPWRSIWSLNIDDVVENAYSESKRPVQEAKSINWNSRYVDAGEEDVKIIHLHGFVDQPNVPKLSEDNFIFDNFQYINAEHSRYPWHAIFRSEFTKAPFLIVGTKLSYEFDLEEAISQGSVSDIQSGRKSYLIVNQIDSLDEIIYNDKGVKIIVADAGEFFKELKSRVDDYTQNRYRPLSARSHAFYQQFQAVRLDSVIKSSLGKHDVFSGDEPEWRDVIEDKITATSFSDKIIKAVSIYEKRRQVAIFITGPAASGKTSAMLFGAKQLILGNYEVYRFRQEEALDIPAALEFLKLSKRRIALLVDGIADFVDDFSILLSECKKEDLPVVLIYSERKSRNHRIEDSYLSYSADYTINTSKISDLDARRFIDKLSQFSRLGRLTPMNHSDRVKYFTRDANFQLFVAFYSLENAVKFQDRIKSEYEDLGSNSKFQAIYGTSCIVNSLGYSLPLNIASQMSGITAKEISKEIRNGGALEGSLIVDYHGLRARHRVIASQVVYQAIDGKERAQSIKRLLAAYAPFVSKDQYSVSSIYTRTFRALMDARVLFNWLGDDSEEIYAYLSSFYGWSARFWEQRALFHLIINNFSVARSYAEKAKDLKNDSFTCNTLGTVLASQAIQIAKIGDVEKAIEILEEAISNLESARDSDEIVNYHPYPTFFTKGLEIAAIDSEFFKVISREWGLWIRKAKALRAVNPKYLRNWSHEYSKIEKRHSTN